MAQPRILAIEDEPDILTVIEYNLRREGFTVDTAVNGEDGVRKAAKAKPDLVLLDLLLPGLDGLEVCRKLKLEPETRSTPIIMVSAKGEESDVVLGLGMGADDYVTKPFSPRELVARVRAVLRRSRKAPEVEADRRVVVEDVIIDPVRHEVRAAEKLVPLTATEFRLLHVLATHPGRVFTRDQLVPRVIGDSAVVIDRNIDVHVRAVRKKLGDSCRHLIETVRGVGYRFYDPDVA